MSNLLSEKEALVNHNKLINMQQSEARLHWQRNNVFLVVSSILLLALSQFENLLIQIIISIFGLLLNISWLFIQQRSSSYIKNFKDQAKSLENDFKIPEIFSGKIKGFEMRRIAYSLPIVFIALWITLIIIFILP